MTNFSSKSFKSSAIINNKIVAARFDNLGVKGKYTDKQVCDFISMVHKMRAARDKRFCVPVTNVILRDSRWCVELEMSIDNSMRFYVTYDDGDIEYKVTTLLVGVGPDGQYIYNADFPIKKEILNLLYGVHERLVKENIPFNIVK